MTKPLADRAASTRAMRRRAEREARRPQPQQQQPQAGQGVLSPADLMQQIGELSVELRYVRQQLGLAQRELEMYRTTREQSEPVDEPGHSPPPEEMLEGEPPNDLDEGVENAGEDSEPPALPQD